MTELITKRCDKCGFVRITKVKVDPKRPTVLQWYYCCDYCMLSEVFMEEPLEDDEINDDL